MERLSMKYTVLHQAVVKVHTEGNQAWKNPNLDSTHLILTHVSRASGGVEFLLDFFFNIVFLNIKGHESNMLW